MTKAVNLTHGTKESRWSKVYCTLLFFKQDLYGKMFFIIPRGLYYKIKNQSNGCVVKRCSHHCNWKVSIVTWKFHNALFFKVD